MTAEVHTEQGSGCGCQESREVLKAKGRDLGRGAPGNGSPGVQDSKCRRTFASILAERLFWDGGPGDPKNAGIGEEAGGERELRVGAEETTVDVVFIKARSNTHAELLKLGLAGDIRGKGMLCKSQEDRRTLWMSGDKISPAKFISRIVDGS